MSDQPLSKRDQPLAKQEQQIAQAKNRAIIPALEALANEIEEREKSGELAKELKTLKAPSLIHNLSKILTALKQASPVVVVNHQAIGDTKDPSFYRANSATNLSDYERKKRREAIEAEIVEDEGKK